MLPMMKHVLPVSLKLRLQLGLLYRFFFGLLPHFLYLRRHLVLEKADPGAIILRRECTMGIYVHSARHES